MLCYVTCQTQIPRHSITIIDHDALIMGINNHSLVPRGFEELLSSSTLVKRIFESQRHLGSNKKSINSENTTPTTGRLGGGIVQARPRVLPSNSRAQDLAQDL